MNTPGEKYSFGSASGDYKEFLRLSGISGDIASVFRNNDSLAEFLPIEDKPDGDLRVDMVLGGLTSITVAGKQEFSDITLIRSANEQSKNASVVMGGEQYKLYHDRIFVVSNPVDRLSDATIEEVRSSLKRALWSREDSLRLAKRWRESQPAGEQDSQSTKT